MIHDSYGRSIYYMRISLTDRCNLRCKYCKPKEFKKLPRSEILRYEEIMRIIKIVCSMGFYKIRLTGGEPLLRKKITLLIKHISKFPEIKDLSITTNGLLLAEMAEELFKAGLRRINISLDTLDPKKYEYITGVNAFSKVWSGIQKALEIGFSPVKINVVALKGINDDEILDLAKLTFDYPVSVRFIEYMPFSAKTIDYKKHFLPANVIKEELNKLEKLEEIPSSSIDGPAMRYKFVGSLGEIGLIAPISYPFCHRCNRIRLTPDGKLRPCLFSDTEYDIKTLLKQEVTDEDLKDFIKQVIAKKPKGYNIKAVNLRSMFHVGG